VEITLEQAAFPPLEREREFMVLCYAYEERDAAVAWSKDIPPIGSSRYDVKVSTYFLPSSVAARRALRGTRRPLS